MGKDREGKYHSPKGRPSGSAKSEGIGVDPRDPDYLTKNLEVDKKYENAPDELTLNTQVRHRNRNVNKDEGDYVQRNSIKNKSKNKSATIPDATQAEDLSASFSRDTFIELAHYSSYQCISVYIPTHRAGVEVNEQAHRIVFKNALQKITTTLKERGISPAIVENYLQPGYNLLDDEMFWRTQSNGLAVFIAPDFFKYIKMPITPAEGIVFNTGFYLNPLIPVITMKEYFYLLLISKKRAKLYRVDSFGIESISVEGMPRGMDDVVHFEEKDGKEYFRLGSSGTGVANFHGIGEGRPDDKEHAAIYLEEVDDTLWKEVLHAENVPLLLAGVEYMTALYRQVTGYNNIWSDALTGNFDKHDPNVVHRLALEKMKPYFLQRTAKVLNEFGNKSGTGLASSVPEDIIPAAYYSRVSILFIQKDEHIWGTFDEHTNELTLHDTMQDDDECLLDKAAIKTIKNGGEVFILEKTQMPADSKMAAIMRF